jgi:uncharacterized Fe-S center protein
MENVYLIKSHLLFNLSKLLSSELGKLDLKGKKVAVKAHMGEYGNLNYLRPPIVGAVVEEIKKAGGKPFLFDTPVAYPGSRDTAKKYLDTARRNGFTEETIGCPVIISDEYVTIESKYIKNAKASKEMMEADAMVVISHFKGHPLSSYGAAIKNIGMGGFSKETKGETHAAAKTKVVGECIGCGACVKACPEKAISLENGRAKVHNSKCFGCGTCVDVCPQKAIKVKTVHLGTALAELTSLVLKKFGPKEVLFVNVLMDIADMCDCDSGDTKIVAPNLGILVSHNIVAIDKASLDLVNKATNGSFSKIYYADTALQTDSAVELGLGDGKYKIIDV